ncbi:MAG TPA: phosphatidate cytidylyltransferase [Bacteroidia bacterium]|nr:phosphatidate cytidylyltransferase [Bacteroidia bacterium]
MKRKLLSITLLFLLFTLSSCEVIGGIFKAGVWVGVLIVVGIIALIVYLISRANKKN